MIIDPERVGGIAALGGEAWGTARLAEETAARARALASAGIGSGDCVLLAHGGSPAFFADLWATWRLGAVAACLNPGLTPPEVERIARFVQARAMWTGADEPNLDVAGNDVRERAKRTLGNPQLDDPALILFTSGTTGTPKGVTLSFRAVLARLSLNVAQIGAAALQRTLCPLPTHFGHGLIGNCLTALYAGGELTLMPAATLKACAALGPLVDERAISFMSSVPTMWKMVLRVGAQPRSKTLERIHVGSAPLAAELWRRIAEWSGAHHVVNMYGLTEAANWIAGASSADFEPVEGLIGRPWGGALATLDASGRRQPSGTGEILVQSPSMMSGYFGCSELNESVLVDGWLRTGDIGTIDSNGVARLTGRLKYEINRAGIKVYPEDVELLLEQNADLRDACVFRVPDEIAGETVGAAISVHDRTSFDLRALKSWCSERLAKDKIPEVWFVVDEIPRTDRGKVNREAVAASCLNSKIRQQA